jgi:hypothetical protein
MSPKLRFPVMLEPHQLEGLRAIAEETGANLSEQIRRAIDNWLERHQSAKQRGSQQKSGSRRLPQRRRS